MNITFTKKIVGTIELPTEIDITDPCYNRDVWCRINGLKIQAGEYTCVVWMSPEKYMDKGKIKIYKRVGIIGIYLNGIVSSQKAMEEIGDVGVDAGLAGFFINKPDYNQDEWTDFCNSLGEKKYWLRKNLGFFSSSGYGDGFYPVYVSKDKNSKITSVEIRFI